MREHEEPDGSDSDVTVAVAGEPPVPGRAALAARFDPLADRVGSSGRVATALPLRTVLVLTTPHGTAEAEATERDAWGNTRIAGRARPPLPVELLDGDGEGVPR